MSFTFVTMEASTRFGVGKLWKSKTEADGVLRDVVAMLERQSGKKLKIIHTNNGTEWIKELLDVFCRHNRIIHQMTTPYGPEQNGITERAIATYFEMVRCMLHSAGMDLQYWGEAFMYSVHIQNLSPTHGLEGKVPLHAWTKKKPDVSHLHIFGSIA